MSALDHDPERETLGSDAAVGRTEPVQARSRALAKTVVYRGLMLVITILVAFVVVGNTTDALNIGIAANVLKTGTYYAHERLWNRISWGVR